MTYKWGWHEGYSHSFFIVIQYLEQKGENKNCQETHHPDVTFIYIWRYILSGVDLLSQRRCRQDLMQWWSSIFLFFLKKVTFEHDLVLVLWPSKSTKNLFHRPTHPTCAQRRVYKFISLALFVIARYNLGNSLVVH